MTGRIGAAAALGLAVLLTPLPGRAADAVTVLAAGSLRSALTELAQAFERQGGAPVRLTFGPSGLLKDRIAGGEAAQVFASANLQHPEALRASGHAASVLPFARNQLCLLAAASFDLGTRSVAQALLDPVVRVGTSTPRADPAGDYAFAMFDKVESTGAGDAGSAARLKAKALQLTGGPGAPAPPAGRNAYAAVMEAGQADVFVTYCTNTTEARRQLPALQVLPVPDAINVSASYGIALLKPVQPAAQAFVDFVRGAEGQRLLAGHGFAPP